MGPRISFMGQDQVYQSLVIPVLGTTNVLIYEIMRRYAYTDRTFEPYLRGRLVAEITRKSVAAMVGCSPRTVSSGFKILLSTGWIRQSKVATQGRAYRFDLGVVLGSGIEVFFADDDVSKLIHEFGVRQHEFDYTELSETEIERRLRITKKWLSQPHRGDSR